MNINDVRKFYQLDSTNKIAKLLNKSSATITKWMVNGIPLHEQLLIANHSQGKLTVGEMEPDPTYRAKKPFDKRNNAEQVNAFLKSGEYLDNPLIKELSTLIREFKTHAIGMKLVMDFYKDNRSIENKQRCKQLKVTKDAITKAQMQLFKEVEQKVKKAMQG